MNVLKTSFYTSGYKVDLANLANSVTMVQTKVNAKQGQVEIEEKVEFRYQKKLMTNRM